MAEIQWTLRSACRRGRTRPRLDGVTLSVRSGVTAVVGCSGAGKSTLLNLLVGFEEPDSGEVRLHEPNLFWVPPNDGLWPHLTARQHLDAVGGGADLLEQFDLADCAAACPATLSAGERSRLSVARALAAKARVLVMDEPLVHVERGGAKRYWQLIRHHLRSTGASLVFATHEPDIVLREAEFAICLSEGRVRFAGTVDDLYWRPATELLAEFLGPVNWMEPDEAGLWLGLPRREPLMLRPEQLQLEPDERSVLEIQEARPLGAVSESKLRHTPTGRSRWFVHPARPGHLRGGQRVALHRLALALWVAVCLQTGCGGRGEPELAIRQITHWPMPPDGSRIPAPRSITMGPEDQFIVLDTAGRVLIFDPRGQLLTQWRMPRSADGNPEGACWLADGRIAVADTHYHRVVFFDSQGRWLDTLGRGSEGGEPGTFRYPVDVVQDDRGHLYVAEYGGGDRVQKFTASGRFLTAFGAVGTGPGQFQRAAGLLWHAGRIYVADAVNGKVHVFADTGEFIEELGPLALRYPYDVALAPDSTLFIVEWGAGRVTRTTLGGKLQGRFGSPGSGLEQLRTPWGIGVDSQMRVRIADTENRRIVALDLDR